jgi:hypothetical protein
MTRRSPFQHEDENRYPLPQLVAEPAVRLTVKFP